MELHGPTRSYTAQSRSYTDQHGVTRNYRTNMVCQHGPTRSCTEKDRQQHGASSTLPSTELHDTSGAVQVADSIPPSGNTTLCRSERAALCSCTNQLTTSHSPRQITNIRYVWVPARLWHILRLFCLEHATYPLSFIETLPFITLPPPKKTSPSHPNTHTCSVHPPPPHHHTTLTPSPLMMPLPW